MDRARDDHLDRATRSVLARYPLVLHAGPLTPLGNRGGFSGARLWRLDSAAGPLGLRAWPAGETAARVAEGHRLMADARRAGLLFVPAVLAAGDGPTVVAEAGRLWELTEWLPGRADFRSHPSRPRLEAVCRALARLHAAWEVPGQGACPAVARRLECVRDWAELRRGGWHPLAHCPPADPLHPLVERACRCLERHLPALPQRLAGWAGVVGALQPCLCDVWHDHLLFAGEQLTGLVDYGAVKVDRVAVDLARLLGSLVGDDRQAWATALAAYRSVRPLSAADEELARVLDETGTVLGVVNWLRWLFAEGRAFASRAAVAGRLGELVERIERWG
jgi:homoserine kinase type II